MSFQTNTNLEGTFTVMDVHGNVLSEQKNRITNWGMVRLTGYNNQTPYFVRSLADNLRKIWIGSSQTPVKSTDYRLYEYLEGSAYTEVNEPTITGTFYSIVNPGTANEKLKIKFVKGSRFEFLTTLNNQISEVGISSNYERPYGDYAVGGDQYDASGWPAGPNGHKAAGKGPYGIGWPPEHQDQLETSLFSRALLGSSIFVVQGDILIIKYVLEITTDAHKVIGTEGFNFDVSTIDPSIASEMPERKSCIRRKPFYELTPLNTITGDLTGSQQGITRQGGRVTADWNPGNDSVNYDAHFQFLPFLEVPAWGKNYIALYEDIHSELYSRLNDGTTFSPSNTATNSHYLGEIVQNQAGTTSFVFPPWSSTTISRSINYLALKDRTTYKTLSSGNTFTCQHRFLFNPGEWFVNPGDGVALVKNFCFLRRNWSPTWTQWSSHLWNIQPKIADRANVGMITCLESAYSPYTNEAALYLGIDYTMTFTRSALT
jgi:hypothetical protein